MTADVPIPGLNRRVREKVYDHIYDNDDHEVGGVLVGRLGSEALPVVTAAIAALEADGRRASVTFTHDAWASIHEKLDKEYPDQQIVGWYHSHPGFGIFLSEHDQFIHNNFFSDPRQIAYVVDPHAGTEGAFGWRSGELVLLREGKADRPGTGGRSTRPTRARGGVARKLTPPGSLRYLAAAVVVLVLAAGAVVLMLSGSDSTHSHPLVHGATSSRHGSSGSSGLRGSSAPASKRASGSAVSTGASPTGGG